MVTEAAILRGSFVRMQTMADGTPRLIIDLPQTTLTQLGALELDPGAPLAIARLTQQAAQQASQVAAQAIYGEEAKTLRLSTFFRTPQVWQAVGTDAEFLAWLRTQPCCSPIRPHGGDVVAAHVRRVSEGAGTGIKPPYCAIPLCDHHHGQSHQYGDSRIGPREWWDHKRIEHVQRWAWEALKSSLGYEHWSGVPPTVLRDWADEHGLSMMLPNAYRSAAA